MGASKKKGRAFAQDIQNGDLAYKPGGKKKGRAFAQDFMPGSAKYSADALEFQKVKTPAGLAYGEIEFQDGWERRINGTSVFDPVLCEIAYRWFCAPGGMVLDPFAGGSVRGIVAAYLGRKYTGIELRPEQIEANRAQAVKIVPNNQPQWIEGDSRNIPDLLPADFEADLLFSCPPYADLEVYSDDPRDLSNMDYQQFKKAYFEIIAKAAAKLKNNRFACFVVGDVRDKHGFYRNFPGHTIEAFEAAGLRLYNEGILVTAAGSLPLRVNRQFEAARKFGKTHQNIYVFCKGDWRKATEAIGPVEFGEITAASEQRPAEDALGGHDGDPAADLGDIL
jgi:DNA modification methylase